MKHTILPLAIVATALLVSCNNSKPRSETQAPVNLTVPTNTSPGQQKGQFTYNPTNTTTTQPVGTTTQPIITTPPLVTTTQTVSPTTTTKAGLNPEHGQPGHRCEIAVGAPLDSKPITTTPAITSTTNAARTQPADAQKTLSFNPTPTGTQTVTIPNPTSTTKPGMNPEHGQPGHRCDIAVGAPLDSKPIPPVINTTPGNTTPTTTPTNTTTSIPQFTPVLNSETKPAVKTDAAVTTGVGLNPEHGKPGHRCDIAVGAPLDSKPTIITEKEKVPTEKKN